MLIRCKKSFHMYEVTDSNIKNITTGGIIPENTQKGRRLRRFVAGDLGTTVMRHKETKELMAKAHIPKEEMGMYQVHYSKSLMRRFEYVDGPADIVSVGGFVSQIKNAE